MSCKETIEAVMPYSDRVIVCLETAADIQTVSCGVVTATEFKVYSESPIDECKLNVIVLPGCFTSKEYTTVCGMFCTTPAQTILDLLEYENDVCIQTLVESLSNYYFEHGESFSTLEALMNDVQRSAFEKWRQDAIDYYTED